MDYSDIFIHHFKHNEKLKFYVTVNFMWYDGDSININFEVKFCTVGLDSY